MVARFQPSLCGERRGKTPREEKILRGEIGETAACVPSISFKNLWRGVTHGVAFLLLVFE